MSEMTCTFKFGFGKPKPISPSTLVDVEGNEMDVEQNKRMTETRAEWRTAMSSQADRLYKAVASLRVPSEIGLALVDRVNQQIRERWERHPYQYVAERSSLDVHMMTQQQGQAHDGCLDRLNADFEDVRQKLVSALLEGIQSLFYLGKTEAILALLGHIAEHKDTRVLEGYGANSHDSFFIFLAEEGRYGLPSLPVLLKLANDAYKGQSSKEIQERLVRFIISNLSELEHWTELLTSSEEICLLAPWKQRYKRLTSPSDGNS